ncbi:hypothetical protein C8J57DRAFT_1254905 [Mycena rebaudengoi]|nr:hypothetical protein C8J57DRAFT_1254905 [Mycena rebaudengoi]
MRRRRAPVAVRVRAVRGVAAGTRAESEDTGAPWARRLGYGYEIRGGEGNEKRVQKDEKGEGEDGMEGRRIGAGGAEEGGADVSRKWKIARVRRRPVDKHEQGVCGRARVRRTRGMRVQDMRSAAYATYARLEQCAVGGKCIQQAPPDSAGFERSAGAYTPTSASAAGVLGGRAHGLRAIPDEVQAREPEGAVFARERGPDFLSDGEEWQIERWHADEAGVREHAGADSLHLVFRPARDDGVTSSWRYSEPDSRERLIHTRHGAAHVLGIIQKGLGCEPFYVFWEVGCAKRSNCASKEGGIADVTVSGA